MSLRAFHIVFVTVTTLLFAFLAAWAFLISREHTAMVTALGGVGIAGTVLMPVYGVIFYRKARKLLL